MRVVEEKVENFYLVVRENYKMPRIYSLKLKEIEEEEFNRYNIDKNKNIN